MFVEVVTAVPEDIIKVVEMGTISLETGRCLSNPCPARLLDTVCFQT